MRRLFVCFALLIGARRAAAQTGETNEGALELIRAIGARSLGMGLAGTAGAFNSEAVWVNPALVARAPREASFDFRNKANAVEPDADVAGVVVVPFQPVGSAALFARYLNNGTQEVSNVQGVVTGRFTTTTLIVGASMATTFFERFAIGFTAKQFRANFSCTGDCSQLGQQPSTKPSVNALDLGTQIFVRKDSSISIGASAVNLGPKFQYIDSPQADPIPARLNVGLQYSPKFPTVPELEAHFAADVVSRVSNGSSLGFRVGGEVSYLKRYQLRAGYIKSGPGDVDTPTIGFGVTSGKVHIDISQMMTTVGSLGGSHPTFLGLHVGF